MAKRKRRPERSSNPLKPIIDYRSDEYTPYIFRAESGILEAWAIDPDIRDGDVRQALRDMMRNIKRSGELPALLIDDLDAPLDEQPQDLNLLEWRILANLRQAFANDGPLNPEDTVGILTVINNSVGTWNRGMQGQEYLKYIRDFLGGMGVEVRALTDEEVAELELHLPDADDDHEPPASQMTING